MTDFILGEDPFEAAALEARREKRERCTDRGLMARAANNALLTVLSRGSMVVVASLCSIVGWRLLTQLDENTKATAALAQNVAVIAVTVTDMVERVKGLEARERETRR